jgi:UDP-N-acetylmuramoyl-L-alanyl-D-glutamate--2,6-diaminopimelate ligase
VTIPLSTLLAELQAAGQLLQAPSATPDVAAVTDDSRAVVPGALFCAIAGTQRDGHAHVAEAVARGAAAAVVTRQVPVDVPQILVRDGRVALSVLARAWFGRPADGLTIVGVTGTNGKTTTVGLIRHLLNGDGQAGSIGTLGAFDGAGESVLGEASLTTPGTLGLQAILAELKRRGVSTVAMEASSHALDQRRLDTLTLRAAVYTNLTHEHLDYHPTLEAYRDAKARLSSYLADDGIEIVNADDPAWRALTLRPGVRRVTCGVTTRAVVRATGVALRSDGTSAVFEFDGVPVDVQIPLLGDFNVANAVAAAATAWAMGVEPGVIGARLARAPQIPGRLEKLADAEFLVLRDYAHTPDALERAIAALRPVVRGRLIVLFGAGGDRDRSKRPVMGRIAARDADLAIVTSDNPRTEAPERIIDEIEAGMGATPHVRITDRRAAIHHALAIARPGDGVLLAGKGHETYQVIGTEYRPFDERAIVGDALRGGAA